MNVRRSLLILTVFLAVGCLPGAEKPDLSGTWSVDLEKSDFGMMPPPTKLERRVSHQEPTFAVSTVQVGARGERTTDVKCTTDNKECDIQVMGNPAKMTAKWDGGALVVTTKASIQGTDILQVEKWSLSEDGKTLTTESSLTLPQGENKSKLVFKKAN